MLNGNLHKFRMYIIAAVLGLLLFTANTGVAGAQDQVRPTPFSMDFFGYIDGVVVGDKVTVFDFDGVLCGEFIVNKAGQYGFLHVYADDPGTGVDEGAEVGDVLTFKLNGELLLSDSDIYWSGDRQRQQVDFSRR